MRKKTGRIEADKGIVVNVTCSHCGTSFKTTLDTKACVKCYMTHIRKHGASKEK